jgi:hypothetical protein
MFIGNIFFLHMLNYSKFKSFEAEP